MQTWLAHVALTCSILQHLPSLTSPSPAACFCSRLNDSGQYHYGEHFTGKKRPLACLLHDVRSGTFVCGMCVRRLWELRLRLQFKRRLNQTDLFFAVELEDPADRGDRRMQISCVRPAAALHGVCVLRSTCRCRLRPSLDAQSPLGVPTLSGSERVRVVGDEACDGSFSALAALASQTQSYKCRTCRGWRHAPGCR